MNWKRGSLSILLLLIFAFFPVMGDNGGSVTKAAEPHLRKLVQPLREMVLASRLEAQLRTQDVRSLPPDMALLRDFVKPEAAQQGGFSNKNGAGYVPPVPIQAEIEPLYGDLVDEVVQERWGNPPYDVLNCYIEYEGDASAFASFQLKIRSTAQFAGRNVSSAEIPFPELEEVARLANVRSITLVPPFQPDNDLGTLATGAARLRLFGVDNYVRGYTGRNVIVGMIDTGADWTHGDFIDPATNTTRILYYWDADSGTPDSTRTPAALFGGALAGLTYGRVYTKAEIDAAALPSSARDTNGHGSHTCGTAAGNGHATGQYTGMAPNADIILVQGLDNNGILFIYEMAAQLGRPCAINMSYGPSRPIYYMISNTASYPGDGTDTASSWISSWNSTYGGGHIPVKSMGNQGHWNTYTGATPPKIGGYHAGDSLTAVRNHNLNMIDYIAVWPSWWGVPIGANTWPQIRLGLWYDSPVRITVITPNGETLGPVVHGTTGATSVASTYMEYYLNNAAAGNGSYYGSLRLRYNSTTGPYAYSLLPGAWTVRVEPVAATAGYCDMWLGEYMYYYGGYYIWSNNHQYSTFQDGITPSGHLSMYANDFTASTQVIGVAAWNSREQWQSIDGNTYSWTKRPVLNQTSDFSTPGPARNRFLKPDISAPGNIVLSTLSAFCTYSAPYVTTDNRHQAMSGTSMSAPHTTGGMALILQKYRDKGWGWPSVPQVRSLIQGWAINDAATSWAGLNAFGGGKLNLLPLNDPPVASLGAAKSELILDNNESTTLLGSATDYESFPLTYEWQLLSQPAGANPAFSGSGTAGQLVPDLNVEGTYQVGFRANDGIDYSNWAQVSILARFYPILPPGGFTVERVENSYIFYKEYINELNWAQNLQNQAQVKNFRIYRKAKGEPDSAYKLVNEPAPSVFEYVERGLKKNDLFTYKITAMSVRGKESDPVVAGN